MVVNAELQSRPMAAIKPGRKLGASWMDDFVSTKRAVSLCSECDRRYGDWQSSRHYQKRSYRHLGDCDGCGRTLELCQGYFYRII